MRIEIEIFGDICNEEKQAEVKSTDSGNQDLEPLHLKLALQHACEA
jgi:hypothetical protein